MVKDDMKELQLKVANIKKQKCWKEIISISLIISEENKLGGEKEVTFKTTRCLLTHYSNKEGSPGEVDWAELHTCPCVFSHLIISWEPVNMVCRCIYWVMMISSISIKR